MKTHQLAIPVFVAAIYHVFALATSLSGPTFPHAEITNGVVNASLYLPDAERGYYRGSRFDWSGVISRLEFKGHNYFGVWFPRYSPFLHDAITGPAEEFRTGTDVFGSALGFDEAAPGGLFVKIGVGVLRKPDAKAYSFARQYEIVNHGIWTTRPGRDRVEFQQDLRDDSGYSYRYQKIVRLGGHRPELILEHHLRNTGRRAIDAEAYDHDFFVMDGQPTGPGTRVIFTFSPESDAVSNAASQPMLIGKAEIRGTEVVYTRELQEHEQAASLLKGFEGTVRENDFRVENSKAGIGVREIGDQPLHRLNLWSIRTTVCPEAFIHLHVEPGKEIHWKIRYIFYELKSSAPGDKQKRHR